MMKKIKKKTKKMKQFNFRARPRLTKLKQYILVY